MTAAGNRSLLAPWLGGASTPLRPRGIRSMLAPWLGGASAGAGVVVVPPPMIGGGGGQYLPRTGLRFDQAAQEDREIMLIIAAALRVFEVER